MALMLRPHVGEAAGDAFVMFWLVVVMCVTLSEGVAVESRAPEHCDAILRAARLGQQLAEEEAEVLHRWLMQLLAAERAQVRQQAGEALLGDQLAPEVRSSIVAFGVKPNSV